MEIENNKQKGGRFMDPKKVQEMERAKREKELAQVKQPAHYMLAPGMEAIDVISAAVKGKTGFEAFCVGSALKYLLRAGKKGPAETDYRKARQYLDFLIDGRPE